LGKIRAFLPITAGYRPPVSVDQIASEALRLSAHDRALLASSLWESLGDPYQAPGLLTDDAAIRLASQRDQEIESGKVQALSHEEMMARLRR
jgi:putative addiction module component (TIGR02574 family)